MVLMTHALKIKCIFRNILTTILFKKEVFTISVTDIRMTKDKYYFSIFKKAFKKLRIREKVAPFKCIFFSKIIY